MARYRLADPAKADVALILKTSEMQHGKQARCRYRALLSAAMRRAASNPEGISTVDLAALMPGMRSFHIRHARSASAAGKVRHPVHVLFYRVVAPGQVEIVRVMHERMHPRHHIPER